MPGTAPRRVVVFDRIDANRRNTRRLVGIFGFALLPVVGWLSAYLPVWFVMFLPGLMVFLQEARKGLTAYLVLAGAITPVLLTVALYVQYRYADRIALRMAKARPLGRDRERRLWDTVEGLCLGTGLPLPKLYVVETEDPNAFSVGLDPGRSSIVVTRGLVSLLSPREMEGVLAHELSHIGNQDIRLNTTVAAMGAILRLPFRLLTARSVSCSTFTGCWVLHPFSYSSGCCCCFRVPRRISSPLMKSTRAACFARSHWFRSGWSSIPSLSRH
jgi:Zn-dependent protease with chaperone function